MMVCVHVRWTSDVKLADSVPTNIRNRVICADEINFLITQSVHAQFDITLMLVKGKFCELKFV